MTEAAPDLANLPVITDYVSAVQDVDAWEAVLARDPEIMFGLIRDVVKIVQSADEGGSRVGRRPDAKRVGFDELWRVLVPERFSVEPLPKALAALVGSMSHAQFALRAGCSKSYVTHALRGTKTPPPEMLEHFAAAGGVSPFYFVEYRAHELSRLVTAALLGAPEQTKRLIQSQLRGL